MVKFSLVRGTINPMMIRQQALEILHQNMENVNLRKHCYAVEAAMRALADHFQADQETWGLVGLLHDCDYEKTKAESEKHTLLAAEWAEAAGAPTEVVEAILSHNFTHTGKNPPRTQMEWALFCCDELTGLIVAATLVLPEKKIDSLKTESILKRMKEGAFAKGVNRNHIEMCQEKLGIPLKAFVDIVLAGMKSIAGDLGL